MADEQREILIKWLADATAVMKANQQIQDETLKTGQILSASMGQAQLSAMDFSAQVDKARVALLQLMATGQSLPSAMAGLKDIGELDTGAINEAGRSIKQLQTNTEGANKSIFDLGNTAQRVFRSIVGFIVLGILRQMLDLLGELANKGKEFQQTIIDLSISVRAVQRAGMDVTFAEVAEQIDNLTRKFSVLTTTELQSGIDQLLIFGQQVGLTKEQIFALSEAVAVKAVTSHKDFATAVNEVSRALGQGMTRGLTGLGYQISEEQIKIEAYESGLAEAGAELDRNTKAQAIYQLMLKQSGLVVDDVAALQETLVGQLTAEENQLQQLQKELGSGVIPLKIYWLKIVNFLVEAVLNLGEKISGVLTTALRNLATPLFAIVAGFQTWQDILNGQGGSIDTWIEKIKEMRDAMEEIQNSRIQNLFDPQGLGDLGIAKSLDKEAEDVDTASDELSDELKDLYIKLREAIISGQQDVAKENRNFLQDMIEDMQKFIFKMKQLAENYAADVSKVWRDYRDKLSEADRKYRLKEINAEKDFQDKMKKLRNKFLLDLEEALEERDARQILRLIREFNARSKELEDDAKKEREQRKRAYEDEKADLAAQRDQRLRELAIEHELRTKQLTDQYEFEKKLAQQEHENKLKELEIQNKERIDKILRQFKDEHDLTLEGAKSIADALREFFGNGGQISSIYSQLLANTDIFLGAWGERIARMLQYVGMLSSGFGGMSSGSGHSGGTPASGGGHSSLTSPSSIQSMSAGSPITAMSNFTPTNTENRIPQMSVIPSQTSTGKAQVLIQLSPGLEGKIVNSALNKVADIIIENNR